jgi:hypothetical protein|tara:strand:- start:855 stop:1223 length:369 start_codon:yes stop_codon:yes gene_type:complete
MKTQDDIDAFNKRNKVQDDIDFIESHPLISRVEVIGEGREFVKNGVNGIDISFQDDGKTLKVFLGELPTMDNDETEVAVEKAAAERLRKSEVARAKRKAVKDTVTTKTENEYAKARRARKHK